MKLILVLLLLLIVSEYHAKKFKNKKKRIDDDDDDDWDMADIKDYSYMVSLVYQNKLLCGATIIDPQWAITAAHCVANLPKELILNEFFVLRGNTSFAVPALPEHRDHRIISYKVHEDFMGDLTKFEGDIAVLQVEEPFNALYESAIDLVPDNFKYKENYGVTMLGWAGSDALQESRPLSFTSAHIDNYDDCLAIYKYIDKPFSTKKFCIRTTYIEPCKQYSGGPMIRNGTLCGIHSFSQECASDHFPGVYTKVTDYKNWILNQLNGVPDTTPKPDSDSESDSGQAQDSGQGRAPEYESDDPDDGSDLDVSSPPDPGSDPDATD